MAFESQLNGTLTANLTHEFFQVSGVSSSNTFHACTFANYIDCINSTLCESGSLSSRRTITLGNSLGIQQIYFCQTQPRQMEVSSLTITIVIIILIGTHRDELVIEVTRTTGSTRIVTAVTAIIKVGVLILLVIV